ncbi:unnamed protein product [Lymnaea stagnalis]|uniref:WD repeat-containing protein 89 n=1 Tax=Lymnaea stagnalis TaxID=6523 RepID=A0AAV2HRF5_LYMST
MENIISIMRQLQLTDKSAIQLNKSDPDYIIDLSYQESNNDPLIAAACSNFTIRLMSRTRLTPVSTIKGHKDTITKVQFGKTDDHLVFSCSRDKSIRCWDTRTSPVKEAQTYKTPPSVKADILSLDVSSSDRLLCAGTEMVSNDSYLLFWDCRQTNVLGCYGDCHQDDITQVSFQPGSDRFLASGSADGLLCTFDLQETSEDDALQITCNAMSDVSRVGWCGKDRQQCVYCVTSDHSVHVWEALQGETYCTVSDLTNSPKMPSDYIIDCIPELSAIDDKHSVVVLTGTHSGLLRLMSCSDEGAHQLTDLKNGHTATVRCSHWDSKTKTLLTGGEDSLVCLWSSEGSTKVLVTQTKSSGKIKSKQADDDKKPYSKKKK